MTDEQILEALTIPGLNVEAFMEPRELPLLLGGIRAIVQAATRDAPSADAKRPVLPHPDTTYYAPWAGHTIKYHSLDQIVAYANACVIAASVPKDPA